MNNRLGAYLEQEILSASGIQLVHLLYQAAIRELRDARRNLAARKIAEKCANISKACDLIGELRSSLNLEVGGEIGIRLDALYAYMLSRLLEGNFKKLDEPVAEVIGLLSTLDEAWKELANERPVETSRSLSAGAFAAGDMSDAPVHAWSL